MFENQENKPEIENNRNSGWERDAIEKLAFAAINEQRTARRWSVFFKSLMFVYLIVLLGVAVAPKFESGLNASGKHTAVIDVVGMITEDGDTNAETIIEGLRNAVKDEGTQGIILHMNTPGGTPVQAAYVFDEIMAIKKENPNLPIYAVVSDICASGGYYIAAAADKIFVNQASIVGSIGVIMDGFGFVDTLNKFGIERRVLTAGSHKAFMDPFSPVNEEEKKHVEGLLKSVHAQFIDAVRQGRGERLKEDSAKLFSGLIWTGKESMELGLADGVGNDDFVAREIIGAEKMVNYTPQERLLDRLAGKLGASFGHAFGSVARQFSFRL